MNLLQFKKECLEIIKHNIALAQKGEEPKRFIVPCGVSAPGLGKTEIMNEICEELGSLGQEDFCPDAPNAKWEPIFFDLRTQNPIDFAGMPRTMGEKSGLCRPDWIPDYGMKIIVLDEIAQAETPILNIAATLIQTQTVGPHSLPKGCMIVALTNSGESVAGIRPLPSHTANRMVQYNLKADIDVWVPKAIELKVDASIISFLKRFPEQLHFTGRSKGPFPSPRSWVNASQAANLPANIWNGASMTSDEEKAFKKELKRERMDGCVGPDATSLYMSHMELVENLGDIRKILESPETAKIPESLDEKNATCGMLIENLQKTPKNFNAILTWTKRLGDSSEWPAIMIAVATANHASLRNHPACIEQQTKVANIESSIITHAA